MCVASVVFLPHPGLLACSLAQMVLHDNRLDTYRNHETTTTDQQPRTTPDKVSSCPIPERTRNIPLPFPISFALGMLYLDNTMLPVRPNPLALSIGKAWYVPARLGPWTGRPWRGRRSMVGNQVGGGPILSGRKWPIGANGAMSFGVVDLAGPIHPDSQGR